MASGEPGVRCPTRASRNDGATEHGAISLRPTYPSDGVRPLRLPRAAHGSASAIRRAARRTHGRGGSRSASHARARSSCSVACSAKLATNHPCCGHGRSSRPRPELRGPNRCTRARQIEIELRRAGAYERGRSGGAAPLAPPTRERPRSARRTRAMGHERHQQVPAAGSAGPGPSRSHETPRASRSAAACGAFHACSLAPRGCDSATSATLRRAPPPLLDEKSRPSSQKWSVMPCTR